ncbi:hypothetical protein IT408_01150 [Candidatus Uhrbacteria bacterium]|nr:hypothetical protein [Candidatus Uhrbacteria bacterium]
MQKKYWLICFSLIGVSIGLTFIFMWLRRPIPVKPFQPDEAHQIWVTTVKNTVLTLPSDAKPEQIQEVREKVSALTVRSEDKESHLALILALIRWEQKDVQASTQVLNIAEQIK